MKMNYPSSCIKMVTVSIYQSYTVDYIHPTNLKCKSLLQNYIKSRIRDTDKKHKSVHEISLNTNLKYIDKLINILRGRW